LHAPQANKFRLTAKIRQSFGEPLPDRQVVGSLLFQKSMLALTYRVRLNSSDFSAISHNHFTACGIEKIHLKRRRLLPWHD